MQKTKQPPTDAKKNKAATNRCKKNQAGIENKMQIFVHTCAPPPVHTCAPPPVPEKNIPRASEKSPTAHFIFSVGAPLLRYFLRGNRCKTRNRELQSVQGEREPGKAMGHGSGKDDRSSADRKKDPKDPPIAFSAPGAKSKCPFSSFAKIRARQCGDLGIRCIFPMEMAAILAIRSILMPFDAFPQRKTPRIRPKRS